MALVTLKIKSDKSKGAKERIPNPGFWSHTVYLPEKPDIFRWFHILQLFFSFYAMIKIIFLTLQVIGDYLYTGRAEAAEGYSFSYIKVRVECEEGLEWSGGAKWRRVFQTAVFPKRELFMVKSWETRYLFTTFMVQKFRNYIFLQLFMVKSWETIYLLQLFMVKSWETIYIF